MPDHTGRPMGFSSSARVFFSRRRRLVAVFLFVRKEIGAMAGNRARAAFNGAALGVGVVSFDLLGLWLLLLS
jgi:hypothetical protein